MPLYKHDILVLTVSFKLINFVPQIFSFFFSRKLYCTHCNHRTKLCVFWKKWGTNFSQQRTWHICVVFSWSQGPI